MNLLFCWKGTRLEILNPVTIDNPELILNVKQSLNLPVFAYLSNPIGLFLQRKANDKLKWSVPKKKLNLTVIRILQNSTWFFWKRCLCIASAFKFKTTEKNYKHVQKDISSRKTNIFQKTYPRFLGRLSLGVCSAVFHQPVELTRKSFFHK